MAVPPLPRPFASIVIVEAEVTREFRREASRWLVDNGCMYMMAWGPDCSLWDDSVDMANLEDFDFGEIPDEAFVMTTWHEDQTLEEVMEFCKLNMSLHERVQLSSVLLLHICKVSNKQKMQRKYHSA